MPIGLTYVIACSFLSKCIYFPLLKSGIQQRSVDFSSWNKPDFQVFYPSTTPQKHIRVVIEPPLSSLTKSWNGRVLHLCLHYSWFVQPAGLCISCSQWNPNTVYNSFVPPTVQLPILYYSSPAHPAALDQPDTDYNIV